MTAAVRASVAFLTILSIAFSGCGGGGQGQTGGGGPDIVPSLESVSPDTATVGTGPMSITLSGSGFTSSSVAQWNGSALATSYQSSSTLTAQVTAADLATSLEAQITVTNPVPGGVGTSSWQPFSVLPQGVSIVNVTANDLAWDPLRNVIYLSLTSTSSANANSIQVLDPQTATLGSAVVVGNEPHLLSVSANAEYLYVSLYPEAQVLQLSLPSLTTANTDVLSGTNTTFGSPYAIDVQASRVSDGTVAVSIANAGLDPASSGVAIYDNGVPRNVTLCGWSPPGPGCAGAESQLPDRIQWGSNDQEMFAADAEARLAGNGFYFYVAPVSSSGFGTPQTYVIPWPGLAIQYDPLTQYVYTDGGAVVDPASGIVVGSFNQGTNGTPIMVVDGALGIAYFVNETELPTNTYTIQTFDIRQFTLIATLTISAPGGGPLHMIRWGTDGLAFSTNGSGPYGLAGPVF